MSTALIHYLIPVDEGGVLSEPHPVLQRFAHDAQQAPPLPGRYAPACDASLAAKLGDGTHHATGWAPAVTCAACKATEDWKASKEEHPKVIAAREAAQRAAQVQAACKG